jgi:hypothetical protein
MHWPTHQWKYGEVAKSGWLVLMAALTLAFAAFNAQSRSEISHSPITEMSLSDLERIPQWPPRDDGFFQATSMIAVLADPARFHGRRIRISGFVALSKNEGIVSFNQESILHNIYGNFVALDLSALPESESREFLSNASGRCISFVGVIDSSRGGWMDLSSCTLVVTSFTILADPFHERKGTPGDER